MGGGGEGERNAREREEAARRGEARRDGARRTSQVVASKSINPKDQSFPSHSDPERIMRRSVRESRTNYVLLMP